MSTIFRVASMVFLMLVLAYACASEPQKVASAEETARLWQQYIDKNEFEKAKTISTERAVSMIEMIESILFEEFEGEPLPATVFLEMNCIEKENSAVCTYLTEEDGEQFRDSFILIKHKGKWLVDMLEEDSRLEEGEAQQIFEDFEQLFEDALEEDSMQQ